MNHDVAVGLHIACDRGGNGEYLAVKQVVILPDGIEPVALCGRVEIVDCDAGTPAAAVRNDDALMVQDPDIRLQIGGNRLDLWICRVEIDGFTLVGFAAPVGNHGRLVIQDLRFAFHQMAVGHLRGDGRDRDESKQTEDEIADQ